MTELMMRHVNITYPNGFVAVKDISLEMTKKEFVVLTGPSGCGKSTILRVIAGLEEGVTGEIYLDGNRLSDIAPKDRKIAMLFRNYALYLKETVYENLALGLRLRGVEEDIIRGRVAEIAERFRLNAMLHRKVKLLTEKEKFRLALGRAMILRPGLLLLDDPFYGQTEGMKNYMWKEIVRLYRDEDLSVLCASNNPQDAKSVATRYIPIG